MAAPSSAALSAYRQILRATRIAFHSSSHPYLAPKKLLIRSLGTFYSAILTLRADDQRVFLAARQEARNNFDQNRRVGVDTGMQINHALEVANILRHNIVQGAREEGNEAAKWGMC